MNPTAEKQLWSEFSISSSLDSKMKRMLSITWLVLYQKPEVSINEKNKGEMVENKETDFLGYGDNGPGESKVREEVRGSNMTL